MSQPPTARTAKAWRPESSTGAGEVRRLLLVVDGELSRSVLQQRLGLKGEANFRRLYLEPAFEAGLLEMTRPEVPQSRLQKYRLSERGRATLAALKSRGKGPPGDSGDKMPVDEPLSET